MSTAPRSLSDYIGDYLQCFRRPAHELDLSFARWVIFGFIIYKLLSRDFSTFAYMPEHMLERYPHGLYSGNFYSFMGFKHITDLASFHWVHWLLPFPDEAGLVFIQRLTMVLCGLTCLLGRGPWNLLAISAYVMTSYLWGYMWRSGSDIDAMFLPLGCMLVYCVSNFREHLTLWRPGFYATSSEAAGWTMQALLMIFVIYYFASGMNKLFDITLLDWLRFDLVQITEYERDRLILGYYKDVPAVFELLRGHYWLNDISVIAVYLSHLFIPMIFYDRSRIPYFWYFYTVFHYMSWGVGILFFGNFIMWFVFFQPHRFFSKIHFEYSPEVPRDRRLARCLRWLNWTGRIVFTPHASAVIPRARISWESEYRQGFRAWRSLIWGMPLLWPLLPIAYLPGAPYIDTIMYKKTHTPKEPIVTQPLDGSLRDVASLKASTGNQIIYDGECPFCDQYVRFLRLQQVVGPVALLNAREHPELVRDLAAHGMNVNKGMVWAERGTLYYDHEAIHRLAILSEDDDAMNTLNRLLFSNKRVSKCLYPLLKFGRRATLAVLRRKPITIQKVAS